MSFISVTMLEGQDDFPRAERELFQWRIRIESEVELDVELKQLAKEEAEHHRSFLIPNG
ncbi:Conserved hypothetical protein [Prochlorococcus marinus str. MIT 9303]|uniref:Uncharacterized protein n=1 Tax=Prochlorococcus marinus (strain MIT 9303) TaxID=59922 RepID=A2C6L6_PROM3|nr:Conserved hypothetical protein [Prochlorococcus marinus str. MIT 9303]